MGHETAVLAFYGLEGSKTEWTTEWGVIPIYPNDPRDYGIERARMCYDDFQADIFIALIDVWVMRDLDPNINFVPWLPVDHDPVPPLVIDVLKHHPGIIKPLVQSKWGQRKLKEAGIDSWYIPNDFKTSLFAPNAEWRKTRRERYKWEDKFIIGMVGTNHAERKNWTAAMQAVSIMNKKHPGEIIFYCHTNPLDGRGINLLGLRENLGIQDISFFPMLSQTALGLTLETMAQTYNVFDVFLLPSKGEGFCRPIVEAESCGVPVVTTRCTSHQEFVYGGWFIENLRKQWTPQEITRSALSSKKKK